jgi:hypothetical protein
MFRYLFILLFYFSILGSVGGQSMHLLLSQVGDSAFIVREKGITEPVQKASFLTIDSRITVPARSGIETMSAGYQFRFGSDTRFTITKESIHLHEGSVMIQSRKIGNKVTIQGPEALLQISGSGTCMVEVETNGGLKILCVLGRIILGLDSKSSAGELLAGELVFLKPGNSGLADKINVNLAKVVETSFLLSGFQNSISFSRSLSTVVRAQQESIGKTYNAEVGDAKEANTFEIVTTVQEEDTDVKTDNLPKKSTTRNRTSYQVPKSNPLEELLGRTPTRSNSLLLKSEDSTSSESRPLPGTLLRFKN